VTPAPPRIRLVAITLVLAACAAPAATSDGGRTFKQQWQDRLPAILEATSEFQREILSDGEVTQAEHERARLAFIGCIEDAGVPVTDLELDENGQIMQLGVAGEEANTIVQRCEADYYSDVREAWRVALRPADTEQAQFARIAECMAQSGYVVSPSPANFGEMVYQAEAIGPEARQRLLQCSDEAQ
jgi:hypothetical protein